VKTLHRVPGERGGIGTVVVGLGLGLALTALWGLRHRRMSDSAGTSRRAQSAGECIRAGSLKPQRCPTTGSSEAKGVDYEWQRRGVSAGAPPALRRGNPGDSAPRNRTMNTLFATVRTAALAAAPGVRRRGACLAPLQREKGMRQAGSLPMEWTPPPGGIAMCHDGTERLVGHLREEASNGGGFAKSDLGGCGVAVGERPK